MLTADRLQGLLVSNNPQVIKRYEKLLALIDSFELLNTLSTAFEANEIIRISKPDIAIIDLNLPDMNGINFTAMIRQDYPETQILVMAPEKIGETVLHALRAGAADFLTYDITLEELKSTLNKTADLRQTKSTISPPTQPGKPPTQPAFTELPRAGKRGKIIAVFSPKGGVGVTSIAINLAIALKDEYTNIAIVDADTQFGDVSVLLNVVPRFSILDMVARLDELDKKVTEDLMLFHKLSGIYLLAAPPRPEFAEQVTGNHMAVVLEFLRSIFDYVIVNTHTFISDPCLAALDAAEMIVLLTMQDIAAIRRTRAFLDLWTSLGLEEERILLILNRFQKQKPITSEKIGERLKHPIPITLEEDGDLFYRANNLGIPLLLEDKKSPVARGILDIAEQIKRDINRIEVENRFRLFELEESSG